MLQQTRVVAVLDRYQIFLKRFPDVKALARADVEDVLALWSGLGYYRRARALHQAATRIAASGGVLPKTAEQWRKLPGIGRYTAAAIASIAFGERCAVVDGNVERVVRRIKGSQDMAVGDTWDTARKWLSPSRPGDFNQALMELGATVCRPAGPQCEVCPLRTWCRTQGELPSKPAVGRMRRDTAYALALRRGAVYLRQRGAAESLMPGMWELPEIEPNGHLPEFTLRHAITVTDFRVSVFRAPETGDGLRSVDGQTHPSKIGLGGPPGHGRWVAWRKASALPLTGLARKILRRAGVI